MKAETESKLKFKQLQRRLKLALWQCRGLLDTLWKFTRDNAPDGNIGRYSAEEIAVGIDWLDDADELIQTLVETKWIDRDGDLLLIHDWPDHCEDSVHRHLARARLYFANGDEPKLTRLDAKDRAAAEAWYAARRLTDPKQADSKQTDAQQPTGPAPEGADCGEECVPGTHSGCTTGVPDPGGGTHAGRTGYAQPDGGCSPPCVPTVTVTDTVTDTVTKPLPNRTEPNRTEPLPGPAAPGPTAPAAADGDGAGGYGADGEIFSVSEADGPEIVAECRRIAEVVTIGKGGKPREDRSLIFKAVVLKKLGHIPERFIAESVEAVKRDQPKLTAAYFLTCLHKRCEQQGRSIHWLLDQVEVPAWAVPILEGRKATPQNPGPRDSSPRDASAREAVA